VNTVRAFVAIDTSPVTRHLERIQDALRNGPGGRAGRWVRASGIHLTLKFLGSVQVGILPDVYAAVRIACDSTEPLALEVGGLGCFPNSRRPRVVWAGVRDPRGRLAALQRRIETELVNSGQEPDRRPFRAHLTLARVHRSANASDVAALGRSVAESDVGVGVSLRADAVYVMQSDLRPSGAVYTVLSRVPLVSGPRQPTAQGS